MEKLRAEYRIEPEMAAEQYVIAMTGMGDTEESMMRLAEALQEIDEDTLSDEEALYYAEVMLRINQKLLEVA